MLPWLLMQGGAVVPPTPTPTPSPAPVPVVPPVVPPAPPEPGFIVPGSSGAGVVVVERRKPWRLHPSGRRVRGHLALSSLPTRILAAGTVSPLAVPSKAADLRAHGRVSLATSVSHVALTGAVQAVIRGQGMIGTRARVISGRGTIGKKRKRPADDRLGLQLLGFEDKHDGD